MCSNFNRQFPNVSVFIEHCQINIKIWHSHLHKVIHSTKYCKSHVKYYYFSIFYVPPIPSFPAGIRNLWWQSKTFYGNNFFEPALPAFGICSQNQHFQMLDIIVVFIFKLFFMSTWRNSRSYFETLCHATTIILNSELQTYWKYFWENQEIN